jgi:hypothetical protein
VFAVYLVAGGLFTAVNKFEPNRLLALVLIFLILALGVAAVARPFTHKTRPNVPFSPKATELPRGSEMTRRATKRPTALQQRSA